MDYEAGDVIVYRTYGGGLRRVRVLERLRDVKRGRPGFDGTVVSGPEKGLDVWGYDDQIVDLRLVQNPTRVDVVRPSHVEEESPGAA